MNVNFKGYGENVATFIASDTVKAGSLVKMSASDTVTPCSANDDFIGVCVGVRNGYATVQLEGYVELATSDSTITAGYNILVAASSGVKSAQSGKSYLVVTVGTGSVGIIL